MSSKKIFIAVGIVVIVAVSVIMFVILSQKEEDILQDQKQNSNSAIPVALPSESQENVELTQKIFENITQEMISGQTKKEGSKKIDFENQKGSPIPLSDFEKALGVEIYPELQKYLNNGYQVFYCPGTDGKKEFGIFLEYDMEKLYRGFTYDVLDMMKNWEASILPNLHAALYPNLDFSENELNQKIDFRDGKYRYAEVNLPDGRKSSIQYRAIEFGIIIVTSPPCLDNVYQHYESED